MADQFSEAAIMGACEPRLDGAPANLMEEFALMVRKLAGYSSKCSQRTWRGFHCHHQSAARRLGLCCERSAFDRGEGVRFGTERRGLPQDQPSPVSLLQGSSGRL
jgi:hypothetical protein